MRVMTANWFRVVAVIVTAGFAASAFAGLWGSWGGSWSTTGNNVPFTITYVEAEGTPEGQGPFTLEPVEADGAVTEFRLRGTARAEARATPPVEGDTGFPDPIPFLVKVELNFTGVRLAQAQGLRRYEATAVEGSYEYIGRPPGSPHPDEVTLDGELVRPGDTWEVSGCEGPSCGDVLFVVREFPAQPPPQPKCPPVGGGAVEAELGVDLTFVDAADNTRWYAYSTTFGLPPNVPPWAGGSLTACLTKVGRFPGSLPGQQALKHPINPRQPPPMPKMPPTPPTGRGILYLLFALGIAVVLVWFLARRRRR